MTIPEYQTRKTKFYRQQKISLKNSKNTSKDNIEFGREGLLDFALVFDGIVGLN